MKQQAYTESTITNDSQIWRYPFCIDTYVAIYAEDDT